MDLQNFFHIAKPKLYDHYTKTPHFSFPQPHCFTVCFSEFDHFSFYILERVDSGCLSASYSLKCILYLHLCWSLGVFSIPELFYTVNVSGKIVTFLIWKMGITIIFVNLYKVSTQQQMLANKSIKYKPIYICACISNKYCQLSFKRCITWYSHQMLQNILIADSIMMENGIAELFICISINVAHIQCRSTWSGHLFFFCMNVGSNPLHKDFLGDLYILRKLVLCAVFVWN